MESRFRRKQLASAVQASGDGSLEALATFRRHPLFSYSLNVLMAAAAIANLATDLLWVRIAVLVTIAINLIGPSGYLTVAAGPQRAVVFERGSWRGYIGEAFEPLDPSAVRQVGGFRWRVADHVVWAWGDERRLLSRLAARAG